MEGKGAESSREFKNRQKRAVKALSAGPELQPSSGLHSCSVPEDLPATAIDIPISQRWVTLRSCGSSGFRHWEADSRPSLSRCSCDVTRKNGAHMETLMIRGSKEARKDRLLSEHILITSITAQFWAAAGDGRRLAGKPGSRTGKDADRDGEGCSAAGWALMAEIWCLPGLWVEDCPLKDSEVSRGCSPHPTCRGTLHTGHGGGGGEALASECLWQVEPAINCVVRADRTHSE